MIHIPSLPCSPKDKFIKVKLNKSVLLSNHQCLRNIHKQPIFLCQLLNICCQSKALVHTGDCFH